MRSVARGLTVLITAVAAVLVTANEVRADTLDCRSGTCTGGTIVPGGYTLFAGLLWTTSDHQSTGSGVIDSFVRIGDNGNPIEGMNTSARPLLNDENASPTFTHDIQGQNIPLVTINGQQYYEFLLDINQQASDPYLSLDGLKLCTSTTGNLASTTQGTCATGGATLKYDLDDYPLGPPTNDSNVLLDYNLNSGSGSGDLFVYVPLATLNLSPGTYLYLWSRFGDTPTFENNDGYEEWAVRTGNPISPNPPVPEPMSLLLIGTGLVAGGRRLIRRGAAKV